MVVQIRTSIKATLLEADNYEITSREKTPKRKNSSHLSSITQGEVTETLIWETWD